MSVLFQNLLSESSLVLGFSAVYRDVLGVQLCDVCKRVYNSLRMARPKHEVKYCVKTQSNTQASRGHLLGSRRVSRAGW